MKYISLLLLFITQLAFGQYKEFSPGRYTKGDTVKVTAKNSLFVADRTFTASAIPSENAYWNYAGVIPVNPNALTLEKLDARLKIVEAKVNSTPVPDPVPNKLPLANAGNNQVMTLPTNTTNLSASASTDPDGTITSWLWIKASGPSAGVITSQASMNTVVLGLVAGTYVYSVTVTDNDGAKATSNVTVTVNAEPTPQPGTTHPLSFTQVTTDYSRPGAGAEQWHDRNDVSMGFEAQDRYQRGMWSRIEGATQGSYTWGWFDGIVQQCIAKKQKLSFGIMTVYTDAPSDQGGANYDGATSAYPLYLHQMMQSESVKDWKFGNSWIPNYNSPSYHARLLALNQAVNQHIYDKGWQNVIQYVDIRGYGNWGEWHSAYGNNFTVSQYPAGTFPTVASLKKIVDAHVTGFPNFPLVAMIAAFDAQWLNNTYNPAEIAHYILTHKGNNWGPIGWRRDQWGATDNYLKDYLENNNRSFNGVVFKNLIMERWKIAPITGEPPAWNPNEYADLERQIRLYHASSFGNGNYGGLTEPSRTRAKAASKASGHRLTITGGTISTGNNIAVTLAWQNNGIAPTYENWNVIYELVDAAGVVRYTATSKFKPKLFLPSPTGEQVTDVFTAAGAKGTYKVNVKVVDAGGYRNPMPLAISGRNTDGSYTLSSIQL
jgi:hypothetical protein